MDARTAPSGQADDKDFFRSEGAMTSDMASTSAAAPPQRPPSQSPALSSDMVTWTASEFIAHHKSASWYLVLGLAAAIVAAVIWLITRDVFSTSVVLIGAALLGVYAAHKPRRLKYQLDDHGLIIGERQYAFSDFRSFSLVPEGAFASIELMPLKRFAMYTVIYFDPADEEKIVAVLGAHLPMEEPRGDAVDQLMRRIRF